MKTRAIPTLAVAAAAAFAIAGCGEKYMPQADVEKQSAIELGKVVGVPTSQVPPIKCPGDLKGEVGTKMTCVLGNPGQKQYDTYITVTKVNEDTNKVFFDIKVAKTPRS